MTIIGMKINIFKQKNLNSNNSMSSRNNSNKRKWCSLRSQLKNKLKFGLLKQASPAGNSRERLNTNDQWGDERDNISMKSWICA